MQNMIRQPLNTNWTLRPTTDGADVPSTLRGLAIPAQVPGCVHTDLLRVGLIEDPYLDFNEEKSRWIGMTDWTYQTTFTPDPRLFEHERIDLVAEGLDTVAAIHLNGTEVARTQNMHRAYRFDIKPLLKQGENTLTITFASPVKYAESMREKLGPRPYVNGPGGPFNFIRKMACNFGWDWGPALPTCGIWKPIRLEGWSGARVKRIASKFVDQKFNVEVELEKTESAKHLQLTVALERCRPDSGKMMDPDYKQIRNPEECEVVEISLTDEPALWWPQQHGEQPLYWLSVEVSTERHVPMGGGRDRIVFTQNDYRQTRIGLRTICLDTSPDSTGSRFALKVNNKEIFCKGFNWIPDDCFLDRAVEPRRVSERLRQAVDAGANMLRVWGGGIYETDDFYNLCDELGILVWQDFPFACAMYPEEEPFKSEVEAEVRDNVSRLAHHPSLAIWNGCNENIWAYKDWGWKDHHDVVGKTWGKNYYLDLIPRVLKELDPTRPYWAGSPWSGDEDIDNGLAPNLSTHGNKHVWEAWFKDDYTAYRNFAPRFCSEFGFQGPATYSSIASVVPPEARDFGSKEMRHRQKSGNNVQDDGDRRNLRHLIKHFNLPGAQELLESLKPQNPNLQPPACGSGPLHAAREKSAVNFDHLHYLLSLNQSRALTLGVEWFRSRQPTCMGTLYWQLNDCWPGGTTWSCIDGHGHKKPLWYATRRFYAPRLLTIQPEADALVLYANNDSDEFWTGEIRINRLDFQGIVQSVISRPLNASPRSNVRIGVLPTAVSQPGDRAKEFLIAETDDQIRTLYFFLPDKELAYPTPDFESKLDRSGGDYQLTLKSKVLMRDVLVQPDRVDPDAAMDDNLITLIPHEPRTFAIHSHKDLTLDQLTKPPVFQCANPFGKAFQ
jgi:beta-mannosidase